VAYHLKVLFIVSVVVLNGGNRHLGEILKRLLEWALMFWDTAGYCGGLGRSNHSLFGDASLLATLVLFEGRSEFEEMAEALSIRLAGQFRDDNLLWLTPSGKDSGAVAWDSYMFLSVYNAWAAAILAWATWRRARASGSERPFEVFRFGALNPRDHDHEAGVLRLADRSRRHLLISTKGQAPQVFTFDEVELRYAGGIPFHGSVGDSSAFLPAIRVPVRAIRATPAVAGWVPIFECRGQLYGLTDFASIDISQPQPGKWVIRMYGAPYALHRARPSGLSGRLLAAADWRLFGGSITRLSSLHRARLPVDCSVRWEFDLKEGRLSREVCVVNTSSLSISYLNPGGCSRSVSTDDGAVFHVTAKRGGGASNDSMSISQEVTIKSALYAGLGCCADLETLGRDETRWAVCSVIQ